MVPFIHLDIPFKVKDTWKDLFPDLNSKQYMDFFPSDIFEKETLDFFDSLGLFPFYANIWSWLEHAPSVWHIDQRGKGEPTVAINFLLLGDPGVTEWIDRSRVRIVDSAGQDPTYGTKDVRFIGSNIPDFAESIKIGYPMMIRNDIPHRVNRKGQRDVRWTIRLSFKKKNAIAHLTWEEAVEILGKYSISP